MDKPTKPTDLMPRSFGGVKNNFSQNLQILGYEDNIPAIYGGDNLNYQLDATGKELDYCEKIVDFINALPIGKIITTDNNNKLIYENLSTVGKTGNYQDLINIPTNLANQDLSNLSATGEAHFVKPNVAVTHTTNTAVGSSSTPVYINSSGKAVACSSINVNLFSTDSDTLANWSNVDYNSYITRLKDTYYTASTNGYLIVNNTGSTDDGATRVYITNSSNVEFVFRSQSSSEDYDTTFDTMTFPLAKGTKYKVTSNAKMNIYFFECIGG